MPCLPSWMMSSAVMETGKNDKGTPGRLGIIRRIVRIFTRSNDRARAASNYILLHVMYAVGIGPSAFLMRLLGQRVLTFKPVESSWDPCPQDTTFRDMF